MRRLRFPRNLPPGIFCLILEFTTDLRTMKTLLLSLLHHPASLVTAGMLVAGLTTALAQEGDERNLEREVRIERRGERPERAEAAEREQRRAQVRERIEELLAAGKTGEAERLKRELAGDERRRGETRENVERRDREVVREREQREEGHGELEPLHRRLHHLHAAAENLRAAGQHDAAESIAQQARRVEEEIHHRQVGREREHHAEAPANVRHLEEQIGALRREVAELRRQLEELRRERR
jgi:chromosome segregation ATPase